MANLACILKALPTLKHNLSHTHIQTHKIAHVHTKQGGETVQMRKFINFQMKVGNSLHNPNNSLHKDFIGIVPTTGTLTSTLFVTENVYEYHTSMYY